MTSIQPKTTGTPIPADSEIVSEQVSGLFSSLNSAIFASAISASVLVGVMWNTVNRTTLLSWFMIMLGIIFVRGLLGFQFRHSRPDPVAAAAWLHRFYVGAIAGALAWGAAGLFLFPPDEPVRQVFLAFVIGGICAGASATLSASKTISLLFISLALAPLALRFLFDPSELGVIMGLMLMFYIVMLSVSTKRIHQNSLQNTLYRIERVDHLLALQQTEDRYRILLENATDALFLHNLNGRFLEVNNQACRSLGYSHEELLRMHVSDVESGAEPDRLKSLWNNLIQGSSIQLEGQHRRKDGSTFPVEVNVCLIILNDEPVFLAIARDITERKKVETRILAAKQEAEDANKAKSEFLSNMSHELRTPLNAILGFGQILEMHGKNDTDRKNAAEIVKAGNHLLELINEILDLSRIEAGKLDITLTAITLDPLVPECIATIAPLAGARNIKVINNINATEFTVVADPFRLKQVLYNLLSNAIKYNRENGTVTLDCTQSDEGRTRISVTDTGKGLTTAQQAKLFQPFDRLHKHDYTQGTGIGLVITQRLLTLMNGSIEVACEPDKGCCFTVFLPSGNPGERSDNAAGALNDESTQVNTPATPSRTVLYIEDNPANLELVRTIIETQTTHRMLSATEPHTGLEIAEQSRPDIILMDIGLPGMSGIEAKKRLEQNPSTRDIPVVAVSADAMQKDLDTGAGAGFSAYLTKPIDIYSLLTTIDQLTSR